MAARYGHRFLDGWRRDAKPTKGFRHSPLCGRLGIRARQLYRAGDSLPSGVPLDKLRIRTKRELTLFQPKNNQNLFPHT